MKPSGVGSNLFVPETPYCLRATNKFEPTEFLILFRLKMVADISPYYLEKMVVSIQNPLVYILKLLVR